MSLFNTTASLRHTSVLPAGTDKAHAVQRLLQDHEFFVQCGPHSVDCVRVAGDEEAKLAAAALAEDEAGQHPLPAAVKAVLASALKTKKCSGSDSFAVYRVTDVVHTLPVGLWDSHVVSTYEMVDVPTGVHVRIRSPMSIVMDTKWTVAEVDVEAEDGGDGGGDGDATSVLELVEEIDIYCSRLLMGTVRGLCEGGWQKIHAKMMARLEEDRQ